MKKIYNAPTFYVEEMDAATMMAVSGFNENLNETGGEGSNALSKEKGDWNIWEEE